MLLPALQLLCLAYMVCRLTRSCSLSPAMMRGSQLYKQEQGIRPTSTNGDSPGDELAMQLDNTPDISQCPFAVEVSGAGRIQGIRNGIYHRTALEPEEVHDRRPIYVSASGSFLYYWDAFKGWRIGNSPFAPAAGIVSQGGEAAACPTDASRWYGFDTASFSSSYPIRVNALACGYAVAHLGTGRGHLVVYR
eukprot:CAMPEP_0178393812 /NCGR_PEP_ID=MMETSP0689_2-20121128/12378_1 /TAXON_ID=160604 /ORGANISM="Amphidinium massartii, Strain CS-259" /LENGTH=191 /DNA_ID=CAMNT_0020014411 /DNA_START=40 /DNA_END=611 /DNA_ORIENTATION=-